jgi:hypothetical protein
MLLSNSSLLTKSIVSMLIVGLAISVAVGIVHVKAPYAKNLEVHLASWDGNVLTFAGSVDINYKNPQAWTDIGYKEGNFQYFYQYWQNQEGKTFSYSGVNVKLIDVNMGMTHNPNHATDHIQFTIKLQQV